VKKRKLSVKMKTGQIQLF